MENTKEAAHSVITTPDEVAHSELIAIHRILMDVAGCPPIQERDTLTIRLLKDLCSLVNSASLPPAGMVMVPEEFVDRAANLVEILRGYDGSGIPSSDCHDAFALLNEFHKLHAALSARERKE